MTLSHLSSPACAVLRPRSRKYHSAPHGLINYIDTTTKCRHLKKLTCKVTLRQVSIRVYRLDWYFRPSFVNCCPPNLLSGSALPFPEVNKYIRHVYKVWGGVLSHKREGASDRQTPAERSLYILLWCLFS
jgi:hypothetical protein